MREKTITIRGVHKLAIFVSQLIREGVTFKVESDVDGEKYHVELTGGF